MTDRQNCWDVKQCGRQPGGPNVAERGSCPAAGLTDWDGINGGQRGGRFCWWIAGTLCEETPEGSLAARISTCRSCDFFQQVQKEEGTGFCLTAKDARDRREADREAQQDKSSLRGEPRR
jgi:hypothetical protein